jgi:hypothetical protein
MSDAALLHTMQHGAYSSILRTLTCDTMLLGQPETWKAELPPKVRRMRCTIHGRATLLQGLMPDLCAGSRGGMIFASILSE